MSNYKTRITQDTLLRYKLKFDITTDLQNNKNQNENPDTR